MASYLSGWRRLAPKTITGITVDAFLDGIADALDDTTYYQYETDPARTVGAGRAWTATKIGVPTECLLLNPPSGGTAAKILIGGKAASATIKMEAPDTFLANALHVAMSVNGGTLTTWDGGGTNDPFGSGQRFAPKFTRCSAAISASGLVHVWESAYGLAIAVKPGASWVGCLIGGIIDGGSTDPLDAESDGLVYATITSGSTAIPSTAGIFRSGATRFLMGHGAVAGNPHNYSVQPGLTTVQNPRLAYITETENGAQFDVSRSGGRRWQDIVVKDPTAHITWGWLRDMAMGWGQMGQRIKSAGITVGWLFGGNDAASNESLVLRA